MILLAVCGLLLGGIAVGLSRVKPLVAFLASPRALMLGRWALVTVGLVALPGCVSALVDSGASALTRAVLASPAYSPSRGTPAQRS